jgi:hypothetical protein
MATARRPRSSPSTRDLDARVETGFCQRCSAWRGSLGLEPDYRLYGDHLVAVLRELRPVLVWPGFRH